MNATYNGKISITSSYLAIPNNMMMAKDFNFDPETGEGDFNQDTMQITSDSFWQHNLNIKTITFESTLNPKEEAAYTYDISANQNGSVMAYLVENGTVQKPMTQESIPAYDMYIQANGKIYANYDSSFLFVYFGNLTEINNMENLDTSYVTDMSGMFGSVMSLTALDVSHFDTSNVTNMSGMFGGMSSLTALDVSHFDTSNVTSMMVMFNSMSSLTALDVSHFDTSNVTSMMGMFRSMSSLTTLDLSHFDTSNVTDMSHMFYADAELRTIVYGSKFIHANNADVTDMFTNCPANHPTDPSWEGLVLR